MIQCEIGNCSVNNCNIKDRNRHRKINNNFILKLYTDNRYHKSNHAFSWDACLTALYTPFRLAFSSSLTQLSAMNAPSSILLTPDSENPTALKLNQKKSTQNQSVHPSLQDIVLLSNNL